MAKDRNEAALAELAEVAGALSEPHRLKALGMLVEGELCLCDLTEGLGLAASTVSNHMAILRRAGLVEARKDGRWMYFRLTRAEDHEEAGACCAPLQALAWALSALPESFRVRTTCTKDECCP